MPTTRVRFGIQTPQEGASYDALATHWREADALGYDTIWLDDHFYGVIRPASEPQLEGFTTLAALARETSRIEIGLLVACNSYRNPALLAKMAATLDEVSGGRLVLGLGSGVPARDPSWSAFGYDGTRHVSRYAEAAEVVTRLLRERAVTFEGEHYRTEAAELIPRGPRPDGVPVLVAGLGERTLAVAARFGDLVNVNRALVSAADAVDIMGAAARACEGVGRDPATLEVTGWVRIAVGAGGIAVERPGFIPGEPAAVAATVAGIHAAGVAHLTFYIAAADDPSPLPALTDETLAMFGPFLDAIRAA